MRLICPMSLVFSAKGKGVQRQYSLIGRSVLVERYCPCADEPPIGRPRRMLEHRREHGRGKRSVISTAARRPSGTSSNAVNLRCQTRVGT